MHNRCPRAPLRRKPKPAHRCPPHKLMPSAGSIALPVVRPPLLLPLGPPTLLLPLGPLVARPPLLLPLLAFLLKHMPKQARATSPGTHLQVR
jgi:hypothetical protein